MRHLRWLGRLIVLCAASTSVLWRQLHRAPGGPAPARSAAAGDADADAALRLLLREQAAAEAAQRGSGVANTTRHLEEAVGPPGRFSWQCHGLRLRPEFLSPATAQWLAANVLFAVITGESYSNRIQTSLCSWMAHVPARNVLLFTDVPNPTPHVTPFGTLRPIPYDMTVFYDFHLIDTGAELYSVFYEEGYYSSMVNQKKKTNYPLGWVKAQYRFAFALHTLTLLQHCSKYKILFLLDDDTFVNWNTFVPRVQRLDPLTPVYLNSQGWGGSGHLFTSEAARRLHPHLKSCVYDYMIKRWGSSDGMLMKCVQRGGIQNKNEPNFHWCGARAVGLGMVGGPDALRSAITIHAKIEYRTDPDEFRKWRINLHYEALTGRNDTAYKLLLQAASCGMCEVAKNKCRYNEVTSPDPFDIFKKMTGYVPTP